MKTLNIMVICVLSAALAFGESGDFDSKLPAATEAAALVKIAQAALQPSSRLARTASEEEHGGDFDSIGLVLNACSRVYFQNESMACFGNAIGVIEEKHLDEVRRTCAGLSGWDGPNCYEKALAVLPHNIRRDYQRTKTLVRRMCDLADRLASAFCYEHATEQAGEHFRRVHDVCGALYSPSNRVACFKHALDQ